MYYNGTSERYWWNQDSDAVNIYVPVPDGFEPEKVEFVAKTRHISLKFAGEEVRTYARVCGACSSFWRSLRTEEAECGRC